MRNIVKNYWVAFDWLRYLHVSVIRGETLLLHLSGVSLSKKYEKLSWKHV